MDNKKQYDKIEFSKFKFYEDGTGFECTVDADDHEKEDIIFFRFNKPIGRISNNLVFAALMTLVGKDWYKNAYFDLSISSHVYENAKNASNTNIEVKDVNFEEDIGKRDSYSGVSLNLSGGIDSNALYHLLKRGEVEFHPIGTDFGQSYARDLDVFKDRVDLILRTNVRDSATKYVSDQKTWNFMGIASLLSVDYYKTKFILFGQVN